MEKVTLEEIKEAKALLNEQIIRTPLTYATMLSEMVECDVYLKLENLQLTGAYKVRGALNKLSSLTEEEKSHGIICSSAGNHAQGVALAAKKLGIKATIVMPETTPLSKVIGTKRFGAEIVLHGKFYDEAYKKALKIQEENNLTFIPPFNDNHIIAGQGTVGLEIYEDAKNLDIVVVPIGGGGLISGVSIALKSLNPDIKIIGVEAENMPAMKHSIEKGKIVTIKKNKTIADGIAVTQVKDITFNYVKEYVDEIVTVTEAEMAHSIMQLLEIEKVLVEASGAASFAAIYYDKIKDLKGKKVGAVISGGNIDLNFLDRIIERGLVEDGRICNFVVMVPDAPGMISKVSTIIGKHRANILDVFHDRYDAFSSLEQTKVRFTIETKGHEHVETILKEIESCGFIIKRKEDQNEHI